MADDEDTLGNVGAPELFRRVLDAHRRTLRTATIGRIQGYRRTGDERNTANVELVIRPDGEEQPVLSNVPLVVLGGGTSFLAFPYAADDTGLVVFCDTEIGTWRQSGDIGAPADDGRLNAAGPVLLPGVRSVDDVPVAMPAGATVLSADDLRLGDETATKAVVHEDLLADLDTLLAALDTWGGLVQAATGVPWAGPQAPLLVMRAGIAAGGYESPTVKVED